ncbi:transposase [Nodosilinea sp. LEGE 07298]|uniref:IS256 family transposase n=1 Tax=Nodosilinea sp. LEGE 07298 TaxID=2777970 RepID=UPI001881EEF6|nr:transposase [Nodosilinea sp. LEGE 07298]MBE9108257.1 transposase [Nodosilinea sp. LEGE 07298]
MTKRTEKAVREQGVGGTVQGLFSNLSGEDVQAAMLERAKMAALAFGVELLEQEVLSLCGARYGRDGEFYRYGSEKSSAIVGAARYPITRPRIRGPEGEVYPEALEKLRSVDLLDTEVSKRMLRGVSTRNYEPVIESYSEKIGISKSSVSRAFIRASQKELDAINGDTLEGHAFVAVLIDGIEIAGTMVVAALGITEDLRKIPIGLKEGDTENAEVVTDLLTQIMGRGFTLYGERLLGILDGGKALKKAVKKVFGERALIQRCWLHKLRNIRAYIPEKMHSQLLLRMRKLMGLATLPLAQMAYKELRAWLESISHEAAASLDEAGVELLTVHALGVTGELRKCLTTTNAIESLFSVVRRKCRKVKNWNSNETKQKVRWCAAAIRDHEKNGMRRLRGVKQRNILLNALLNAGLDTQSKAA